MFAYMNEGHAAMDAGDRPGPTAIAAWDKAEGVLGVASKVHTILIGAHARSGAVASDAASSEVIPPLTPPSDPVAIEQWALAWATRRKEQKSAKNYAEADRIRDLLKTAGWEVRDKQDGSVEVVRIKRAS
jgi:cysteinyl-tRNA synthetase